MKRVTPTCTQARDRPQADRYWGLATASVSPSAVSGIVMRGAVGNEDGEARV